MRRHKRRGADVQLGDAQSDISLNLAIIFILLFVMAIVMAAVMTRRAIEAQSAQADAKDASKTLTEQVEQLQADLAACETERDAAIARAEKAERELSKQQGMMISSGMQLYEASGYALITEARFDPNYQGTGIKGKKIIYRCMPDYGHVEWGTGRGGAGLSERGIIGR
ncbi:MAG: hypothetical protein ABH846_02255 [Patescibacteria group bacterium]